MESWGALAQLPLLLSQDHLFQDRTSESRNIKPRGTRTINISEIQGIVAGKRSKKQGPMSARVRFKSQLCHNSAL